METYFSISRNGTFVFRTDVIGPGGENEVAKVEALLQRGFLADDGYKVTKYRRPAGWTTSDVTRTLNEVPR